MSAQFPLDHISAFARRLICCEVASSWSTCHGRYFDCNWSRPSISCLMSFLLGCSKNHVGMLQLRAASNGSDDGYPSSLDSNAIVSQLQEFKRMIIQSQAGEPQMHAGCTAVVALKCGNALYVANAGDSRGVLCRAGVMQANPC